MSGSLSSQLTHPVSAKCVSCHKTTNGLVLDAFPLVLFDRLFFNRAIAFRCIS